MGVGKIMQLNLAAMFMIDLPSVHLRCAVYKKIPNIRYLTSLGCFSSFAATPQVYFDRVCRESALLFHILCTFFPFFFLIENLFNIYLNVICIFFYFQIVSNWIFPAWSSMLQRNSDQQCHVNFAPVNKISVAKTILVHCSSEFLWSMDDHTRRK